MKALKNMHPITARKLFKFQRNANQTPTTTDPVTITINTNTGTTATIITRMPRSTGNKK